MITRNIAIFGSLYYLVPHGQLLQFCSVTFCSHLLLLLLLLMFWSLHLAVFCVKVMWCSSCLLVMLLSNQ